MVRPPCCVSPGVFSTSSTLMPLWAGVISVSVFTSVATMPERSPFVTHIFWPFTT